jgi:hypothetical protein
VRGARQTHHIVIVLSGRRVAAGDPVEQLDVVAVEQGFEPIKLGAVETREEVVRERAKKKVDLLSAAAPRAKLDSPASSIRAAHVVDATGDMCAVGYRGFNPVRAVSRANWFAAPTGPSPDGG